MENEFVKLIMESTGKPVYIRRSSIVMFWADRVPRTVMPHTTIIVDGADYQEGRVYVKGDVTEQLLGEVES